MASQPLEAATPARLAVSLNGAVALGAYEAGVLAQVYADAWEMNQRGTPVVIDVISGASAGSVVGLLLAQALTISEPPASFSDRLRRVWISGLNIIDLLGNTDNLANALFDPDLLKKLAHDEVLNDAIIADAWAKNPKPPVALSIAVTNLEGIPFGVPVEAGPDIIAYLYADYEPFLFFRGVAYHLPPIEWVSQVTPATPGTLGHWADGANAAMISGSFPAAFKTQPLLRELKRDYPGYAGLGPDFPPSATVYYTDGGILDNQPVGRAIDATSYIRQLEGAPELEWSFLVIEPAPTMPSCAIQAIQNADAEDKSNGLPLVTLGGRLIETLLNDALYRDLAQVAKTNDRLINLEHRAMELELSKETHKAVKEAAGLGDKLHIKIERISPGGATLYGSFLGHFGGFLHQPYREWDYYTGVIQARAWTTDWATRKGLAQPTAPLVVSEPPPLSATDGAGIPAADRLAFENKLIDRAETLLRVHSGFPKFVIFVVQLFRGPIRRWLDGMLLRAKTDRKC